MRHGNKNNALSRTKAHRDALLSNMACSLIEHKRINTTLAKAKALRIFVEPLLTKGKSDNTHSRRIVFSYLQNKEAVAVLIAAPAADVKSVRINVTMPADVLDQIDRYAEQQGFTRSGFLAQAAKKAMAG